MFLLKGVRLGEFQTDRNSLQVSQEISIGMGFYLRKSLRLGPIRLNLSKSGVGVSTGIRGLRYGVRPNGSSYIHAGRYGLYYRKELGRGTAHMPSPPPTTLNTPIAAGLPAKLYSTAAAAGRLRHLRQSGMIRRTRFSPLTAEQPG